MFTARQRQTDKEGGQKKAESERIETLLINRYVDFSSIK